MRRWFHRWCWEAAQCWLGPHFHLAPPRQQEQQRLFRPVSNERTASACWDTYGGSCDDIEESREAAGLARARR